MKFEIRRAKNGWILEYLDPEDPSAVVSEESDDEHEGFANFLREITFHFGPTDSKYSPKRLRVVVIPGRDHTGHLDPRYRESLQDLRDDLNGALAQETESDNQ